MSDRRWAIELLCEAGDVARIRFARWPTHEVMTSMLIGRRADRVRMHQPLARTPR